MLMASGLRFIYGTASASKGVRNAEMPIVLKIGPYRFGFFLPAIAANRHIFMCVASGEGRILVDATCAIGAIGPICGA
jgi:hypothetical protein